VILKKGFDQPLKLALPRTYPRSREISSDFDLFGAAVRRAAAADIYVCQSSSFITGPRALRNSSRFNKVMYFARGARQYDHRAIPSLRSQISRLAAASTIPVANAAMQENSKISSRSLIIVASPVRLPPRAATEAHSRT
jgi:hypothetical protein